MKILEKGIMPNGTEIQIEDWNEDYSFMSYGRTIASYPKSKISLDEPFSPKRNKPYRFEFDFESSEKAKEAFNALLNGTKVLSDFKENLCYPEFIECI